MKGITAMANYKILMASAPYYYQWASHFYQILKKKKVILAVKTEIYTANRDEAVNKSRDIGI